MDTNTAAKATTTAPPCPLDDVVQYMERFIAFTDPHHATVLALWVAHTYAFEAAYATPYIYITSAEKQSGKTRVIEVLSDLAKNPIVASSVSPSVIYRDIEASSPTLFIDEVDAIFRGGASNEDLRNILNSGYKHNGSVRRTVPGADGGEVKSFRTFAPKLLAGIENAALPDTIADRCIRIVLKRKKKDQEVERYLTRKVEADAAALREKLELWVRFNMDKILVSEPKMVEEISDRAFEIAEPLLAIAGRCKGWTARAREATTALLKPDEKPLSIQAQILLTAQNIMQEQNTDRISSALLAEAMNMNGKALGVKLAPYGIRPTTIRFPGGAVAKGYHRRDFEDAWERYL